ncbi:MAG: amidohydrolase family protein [Rhodothermales bacterium]|nr:amidohydrolase family protein [Rhodothermales bacterium]
MNCFLRLAAAALLLAFSATGARAQSPDLLPPVTRTYAIVNARIVQAPGRVIPRGTVLVRDGLITGVGAGVSVPFDAEVIPGDSLVVYAGFIDGLSNAGIPAPKPENTNTTAPDVSRSDPPDAAAGIQPERFAHAMIDPEDSSIAELRNAGFTAAHIVPYGNMLPGSGAVVLLDGTSAGRMVLASDVSMFFQFDGARRVYPATPMGVMAKFRQLYREAERRQHMETLYASSARGIARPAYDPVHYAFFPVIAGEKPVFIYADNALEIYRALRLQQALGFKIMIGGLYQAFDALDQLAAANVPLFLTLKLPNDVPDSGKKDSVLTTDSTPHSAGFNPNFRTTSYGEVAAETQNLAARQAIFRQQYIQTAADLHEAGLRFGFTTKEVKPADIHKNLRKMVKAGLPEDAALAALTTDTAGLLGLSDNLGTVETGKIANLVVANGPLFAEKTALRLVFVDGKKFEVEAKKPDSARKDTTAAGVNAIGSWEFVAETAGMRGILTFTGSPDAMDGNLEAEGQTLRPLQNVAFTGNQLSFEFFIEEMGAIKAALVIDGNTLDGTFTTDDDSILAVTGSRRPRN